MEAKISLLFGQSIEGVFLEEEKKQLKELEENKRKLLDLEDSKWRMKSWALRLAQGDQNSKFFQNYAK